MQKSKEKILKANDVEISGCLKLENTTQEPAPSAAGGTAVTQPKAAVVENTQDFVVIEVVCACGRKTRIKCDYAATAQSAEKQV